MLELKEMVRQWITFHERTQAYLARKAGLDESYVSMILNGQRKPGRRAIAKLEIAMGLPPGTLADAQAQADGFMNGGVAK